MKIKKEIFFRNDNERKHFNTRLSHCISEMKCLFYDSDSIEVLCIVFCSTQMTKKMEIVNVVDILF